MEETDADIGTCSQPRPDLKKDLEVKLEELFGAHPVENRNMVLARDQT
jgi:hypothetical protein